MLGAKFFLVLFCFTALCFADPICFEFYSDKGCDDLVQRIEGPSDFCFNTALVSGPLVADSPFANYIKDGNKIHYDICQDFECEDCSTLLTFTSGKCLSFEDQAQIVNSARLTLNKAQCVTFPPTSADVSKVVSKTKTPKHSSSHVAHTHSPSAAGAMESTEGSSGDATESEDGSSGEVMESEEGSAGEATESEEGSAGEATESEEGSADEATESEDSSAVPSQAVPTQSANRPSSRRPSSRRPASRKPASRKPASRRPSSRKPDSRSSKSSSGVSKSSAFGSLAFLFLSLLFIAW